VDWGESARRTKVEKRGSAVAVEGKVRKRSVLRNSVLEKKEGKRNLRRDARQNHLASI